AVAAAAVRTQRAGRAEPRLVVALKAGGDGGLLPEILAAYRAHPDAVEVELVLCAVTERARMLRDGTADVAFLHSPYEDLTGFDSEPLRIEGSVAILPPGHRLAGRSFVRLADLEDDPAPCWPGQQPGIRDAAVLMQLVALGRLIAVAPESVAEHLRRDLVAVPVLDGAPTTVVLAWPEGTRSRALGAFVHTATTIATRHPNARATVSAPHPTAATISAQHSAAGAVPTFATAAVGPLSAPLDGQPPSAASDAEVPSAALDARPPSAACETGSPPSQGRKSRGEELSGSLPPGIAVSRSMQTGVGRDAVERGGAGGVPGRAAHREPGRGGG
ncbi:LysR substrate-binding domain-containing protein, partial [Nonomuraea sp. NPDC049784]|uniref:LysR substrate-binding domain-containing protein n=1 Tax=Nonomuraea sp. NPDC049784 TaxID=3154361 RepID=UPI003401DBB4